MNDLQQALVKIKPIDNGGAIVEERFLYQRNWAICKLLELHKSNEDYLMIFEYHDDILILDNSENPNQISFYQIKTKSRGNWTINKLLERDRKINSYLGKLYTNKINFPNFNGSLNFVSNAKYSFTLSDPNHKSVNCIYICCGDLCRSEKDTINNTLSKELTTKRIDIESSIHFHVSNISIDDSDTFAIAALVDYFEESNEQHLPPKLKPLHETLINEIIRKSRYKYDVPSFKELIDHKSITRQEFNRILTHAITVRSPDLRAIQSQILSRLDTERATIKLIQQFNRNSNQYLIDKLDVTNKVLTQVEKELKLFVSTFDDSDFDQELLPCSQMILNRFSSRYGNRYGLDDSYLHTIILFGIYGDFKF